jgi:6-pyruvoyltetrahydropterin/6-carboxytetrahydropterin synthase
VYRLQVKTHFDAAHKIADYKGKCVRLHGHTWYLEVVIEGLDLDPRNILIDFSDVKRLMDHIIDKDLDHDYLNEKLNEKNLTAEFLAAWFFPLMKEALQIYDSKLRLARVCIWESPDCCVKYYGDKRG